MADPSEALDPLGDTLHFLRMSGVFYCRSEFTAPFALDLPAFEASMMFHVVTAGECWLEVAGAEPYLPGRDDCAARAQSLPFRANHAAA